MLRISSCAIDSVNDFVESLRVTVNQVKKSAVTQKETFYVKKLEIAGHCSFRGLQFLENNAHVELERRLKMAVPDIEVDCRDIYYWW
ncbi:hypothetical protein KIN20_023806 [Parelaphostrongylus tenuis]|uniref:Uncharacterized protein n=1 Tax=Parelaphostrongylus tenuis TaxID=148309 RepID=A0AAD5MSA5_PARTN|nr:hypothetical protein KIN20_023806 [Parelaphostrongylus tenuis]